MIYLGSNFKFQKGLNFQKYNGIGFADISQIYLLCSQYLRSFNNILAAVKEEFYPKTVHLYYVHLRTKF